MKLSTLKSILLALCFVCLMAPASALADDDVSDLLQPGDDTAALVAPLASAAGATAAPVISFECIKAARANRDHKYLPYCPASSQQVQLVVRNLPAAWNGAEIKVCLGAKGLSCRTDSIKSRTFVAVWGNVKQWFPCNLTSGIFAIGVTRTVISDSVGASGALIGPAKVTVDKLLSSGKNTYKMACPRIA